MWSDGDCVSESWAQGESVEDGSRHPPPRSDGPARSTAPEPTVPVRPHPPSAEREDAFDRAGL